ncbi:hypothetical protein KC323_g308 [Hortaea werneckii]|nr:hypothetical protein KC323_g308 [Hortaea werneckii]
MDIDPPQPPYLPTSVALIGSRPTVDVDVPILAMLLLLYLGGAIGNASIFLRNRKRGHFFPMSMAMFGFCMSRIATCSVRIAWAAHPTNANLAIAATIFAAVGILIVFVIVLLLAQRILRATHPKLGWSRTLSGSLKATYFGLFIAIVLVIAFTILNYFTLDSNLRNIAMWIQRAGILYMLGFNLIGPVLVLLSLILPCPTEFTTPDNFGVKSSMLSKYAFAWYTGCSSHASIRCSGYRINPTVQETIRERQPLKPQRLRLRNTSPNKLRHLPRRLLAHALLAIIIKAMLAMTGVAIYQNIMSLWLLTIGIGSKFMPKYPVKNVKGRKNVDTIVSCRTLSFCLAVMRLNIRDVRALRSVMTIVSARIDRSAHCVHITQRSHDCTDRYNELAESIAEVLANRQGDVDDCVDHCLDKNNETCSTETECFLGWITETACLCFSPKLHELLQRHYNEAMIFVPVHFRRRGNPAASGPSRLPKLASITIERRSWYLCLRARLGTNNSLARFRSHMQLLLRPRLSWYERLMDFLSTVDWTERIGPVATSEPLGTRTVCRADFQPIV